jgi:hypothetical protein
MLIQIPFGSKIAFHDNKMVHRHGYVHLYTHTDGSLHVTSNRTNSDGSAVTHGLTPTSTSSYTLKGKLDCASQTNGPTVSDCPNETHVHHVLLQYQ